MKSILPAKIKHVRLCITNACPNDCSFCYRHRLDKPVNSVNMSNETAHKAIKFIYENLELEDGFVLMPWGGEPMVRLPLLKELAEKYSQIKFHTNTSGETLKEQDVAWFLSDKAHNFTLTWSLGNSYERYGSVQNKIKSNPFMVDIVKARKFDVNLTVTNPENLVKDYEFLREIGFELIAVQQVLGKPYTQQQLDDYAKNLLYILETYREVGLPGKNSNNPAFRHRNMAEKSLVWYKEFGPASLANNNNICTSGIDKLFIDTDGGIWQCDGSYLNQEGKLGDVYNGIDRDKVAKIQCEHLGGSNRQFSPCLECDIRDVCPNTLCLATNKNQTGDKFKPYNGFCSFQHMLVDVFRQYVENRKREGNV